ncbi:MAG: hypothetical protein PHW96_03900 [Candidatus Nanoarchaeia archaeon]|nr:hypothetical protein [Candidatus Nanoarchaeia archaeon]
MDNKPEGTKIGTQVCCGGTAYTGECCTNANCVAIYMGRDLLALVINYVLVVDFRFLIYKTSPRISFKFLIYSSTPFITRGFLSSSFIREFYIRIISSYFYNVDFFSASHHLIYKLCYFQNIKST